MQVSTPNKDTGMALDRREFLRIAGLGGAVFASELDGALDRSAAYIEHFGPTHYTFEHKGVHFIALDNVSDPAANIGEEQLAWLKADLERQPKEARIVVLTHRPLFPLYPQWDWATGDGERAIELL